MATFIPDVPLLALQSVEQLGAETGQLRVADVELDARRHRDREEERRGDVDDLRVLDVDVDVPAAEAHEGARRDVLDLLPVDAQPRESRRVRRGEVVAEQLHLHLHVDLFEGLEVGQDPLYVHEDDLREPDHLELPQRLDVDERPALHLGAPLEVVHLEHLEVVQVLEVPLDDVGDGVGGDVEVAEVGELGPGRGEAEAQVGDLVVRNVEALQGGIRENS